MAIGASSGASTSDILTTLKNIVTALNNETQTYLNVNGLLNSGPITVPTVIKTAAGRVAVAAVTTAGSTVGIIYDGASLTATTKPIAPIAEAVSVQIINMPVAFGILVIPGAGMSVTLSYS